MGFLLDWLHFCCSSRRKIYYLPRRYKFMSRLVACSVLLVLVYLLPACSHNDKEYKRGLCRLGKLAALHIPKIAISAGGWEAKMKMSIPLRVLPLSYPHLGGCSSSAGVFVFVCLFKTILLDTSPNAPAVSSIFGLNVIFFSHRNSSVLYIFDLKS